VEDWKKGHNKACKALFIDRVDKAYDVGYVGLTHDDTRVRQTPPPLPSLAAHLTNDFVFLLFLLMVAAQPVHMLTKDDVRDSAGGWWMLPSASVTTDAEGLTWVQEHFDTKNFNVKFFPWTDFLIWYHCPRAAADTSADCHTVCSHPRRVARTVARSARRACWRRRSCTAG
jgi:hypothetical protein